MHSVWMRDVKFFSVELLLCMCSTQLYAPTKPSAQWPGVNSSSDVVMNFLYSRGEAQLRAALGTSHSSSAFSSCMAVQLVRGLVVTACAAEIPDRLASPLKPAAPASSKSYKPTTAILTQLVERHGCASGKAGAALGLAIGSAEGEHGIGSAVQDILIGKDLFS